MTMLHHLRGHKENSKTVCSLQQGQEKHMAFLSANMPTRYVHQNPLIGDTELELIRLREEQELLLLHEGDVFPEREDIVKMRTVLDLSLIHISEPTRLGMISYAVFCLK